MLILLLFPIILILTFLVMYIRMLTIQKRCIAPDISFFHPYCNAGGGGERVLWQCILAILHKFPSTSVTVYTGDTDASSSQILDNADQCFGMNLPRDRIRFVFLKSRFLVEAKYYPVFTLLGQSVGSMVVGLEALWKHPTAYFVDSMGYAFTYLLAYAVGCDVISYVHYPTISTDMLGKVKSREMSFNNSSLVAKNPILSSLKLIYYRLFAWVYGAMGKFARVVFVNSSWTEDHINNIWNIPERTYKLYPPCNTSELMKINTKRQNKIISVGQFRPEKDHALQIEALKCFVEKTGREDVVLTLVGGARNDADRTRISQLKELTVSLGIDHLVQFKVSIPFSELYQELGESLIGLHTMRNEHFGIGVVEFVGAGIVPIAHDSGGPKMDIVVPGSGFLATTKEEYCDHIIRVLRLSEEELSTLRQVGRKHIENTFSDDAFRDRFLEEIDFVELDDPYEAYSENHSDEDNISE